MEKQEGMVTIPLSEYDKLREFKKNIINERNVSIFYWGNGCMDEYFFNKGDETSDFLLSRVKETSKEVERLKKELQNFRVMSFYELKDWWKKNKY